MSVLPSDPDSNPFGVLAFLSWDHGWNQHQFQKADIVKTAALIAEAGIGWVRMDFFWSDLEPERNRFDFVRYDAIVEQLRSRRIQILAILHYNPSWRQGPWNQAPDSERFVNYCRRTVAHFKDQIKYWEIWNEPDHPIYWEPQDDLGAYTGVLKTAYPAIKQEDSRAQILLGGLSDHTFSKLRNLYQKDGKNLFDIMNVHPFVSPLAPDPLGSLRKIYEDLVAVMTEFNDEKKPIWFTEIGCPGLSSADAGKTWWLGQSPSEKQQAQWLERVYGTALQWKGVRKIFWAFFRDTPGHFGDAVDFFGLIRKDFSKKPAYDIYKTLIKESLQRTS